MTEPLHCLECRRPAVECDCPSSIRLRSHVPIDVYRSVRSAQREIELIISEHTHSPDLWCLECGAHADRCQCKAVDAQHVTRAEYDAEVLRVGGRKL